MSQKVKKIWNTVTTSLVALVVLFAVLLVGVRLIGLTPYTVLSGSMEPVYHVGSLIYVRNVDTATLRVGDAITFYSANDVVVTHQIIEILTDEGGSSGLSFRTQGIANDIPDGGSVPESKVIGKPVFTIPLLGYVAHFIQNPPGMYIAISVGALLLLLSFLPDLFATDKTTQDSNQPPQS